MNNQDSSAQKHSPPKLPPKSRFNDEESTAVLRLLVKQQKLLKTKDENPALRLSPEKSTRHLPPVAPDLQESIQGTERQKESMNHELSYYGHVTACASSENSRPTSAGGIYQSPKLARSKDRPKCSYGRRQQQEKQQQHQQQQEKQLRQLHQTEDILRLQSRKLDERERKYSYQETITKLKEQTLKLGGKKAVSRTRSCPVNYDTNIPPISQNDRSMNCTSLGLTHSMSQITLKSAQSRKRNLHRTNTLS